MSSEGNQLSDSNVDLLYILVRFLSMQGTVRILPLGLLNLQRDPGIYLREKWLLSLALE